MRIKLNEFIRDHAEIFALILGMIVFFNFTDASNPAVKSLLWLFSSFMIVCLIAYVSVKASMLNTSVAVKFVIGLPLYLINLLLILQIIISLFEPRNIYSLNVVSQIFTLSFLYNVFMAAIILSLIVIVIILILKLLKKS